MISKKKYNLSKKNIKLKQQSIPSTKLLILQFINPSLYYILLAAIYVYINSLKLVQLLFVNTRTLLF